MKCNHCGRLLPDDSEFCQYCGWRIEKNAFDALLEKDLENAQPEQVLADFMAATTIEGIKTAQANKDQQDLHLAEIVKQSPPKPTPQPSADRATSTVANSNSRIKNVIDCLTGIFTIILSAIAGILTLCAMNLQDADRDLYEDIPPTAIYLLLLFLCIGSIIFACINFKKSWADTRPLFFGIALILSIVNFICIHIDAVSSSSYYSLYYNNRELYLNNEIIETLNVSFAYLMMAIIVILLLWFIYFSIDAFIKYHRTTVRYKEQCYKRVEKVYNYYKNGIITEEEYEKTKKEITRHIT